MPPFSESVSTQTNRSYSGMQKGILAVSVVSLVAGGVILILGCIKQFGATGSRGFIASISAGGSTFVVAALGGSWVISHPAKKSEAAASTQPQSSNEVNTTTPLILQPKKTEENREKQTKVDVDKGQNSAQTLSCKELFIEQVIAFLEAKPPSDLTVEYQLKLSDDSDFYREYCQKRPINFSDFRDLFSEVFTALENQGRITSHLFLSYRVLEGCLREAPWSAATHVSILLPPGKN